LGKRYRILKTYAIVIDVDAENEEQAMQYADQKNLKLAFDTLDKQTSIVSIFWVKREDAEDQIKEI
jgi:hypothetical protein